tara:strand:+ start:6771 stop:7421 length:651 start_codon:yes stop_codon:yes gene_type:complete
MQEWGNFLASTVVGAFSISRRFTMPDDETTNPPDDSDIQGPKPPTNPVKFARWVQRPRITPKKPKVQPDDSAMRLKPIDKPDVNRSIGTDNPKHPKQKNPNNTRLPPYLRPDKGRKTAPQARTTSLVKSMMWLHDTGPHVQLSKMSPATLAAFGLGWYISDTLTRDEKQSWQNNLDDEFNRSVERAEASNRISRSGKKIKKSAYDESQEHYRVRMK